MGEVLQEQANDAPAENYLLVGSDSRENVDPEGENSEVIGSSADVVGKRSDTIMILRREQGRRRCAAQHPSRPVGADRRP